MNFKITFRLAAKKAQLTEMQKIKLLTLLMPWSELMLVHIQDKGFQEFLVEFDMDQKKIIVDFVTKTNVEFISPLLDKKIEFLQQVVEEERALA